MGFNFLLMQVARCLAIFGLNKLNNMKKILFILLAIAPFAMTAQTKIAPANEQDSKELEMRKAQKEAAMRGNIEGDSFFSELVLTDNGVGGIAIRFDFGQESMKMSEDKELIDAVSKAREQKFTNVPDAMATLSKMGFKYVTSYTVGPKGETHMVFEKKFIKRGQRPAEGGNINKPAPVEKPVKDDSKPAPTPSKTDGKSGKK